MHNSYGVTCPDVVDEWQNLTFEIVTGGDRLFPKSDTNDVNGPKSINSMWFNISVRYMLGQY